MKNQLTKRWSIHLLLAAMLAMASIVSLSSSQQVMAATTAQSDSEPADDASGVEDDGNDDDDAGDDDAGDDDTGDDDAGDDDAGDDDADDDAGDDDADDDADDDDADDDADDDDADDDDADDDDADDDDADDDDTDDDDAGDDDADDDADDDDADDDADDDDADDDDADDDDTDDDDADDDDADDDDADDEDENDEDENDEAENDVYGTVDAMPSSTLIGTWIVDGISYEAVSSTEFEEEQGAFGVGVTVELEFTVVNGLNQLDEVETHRAPGTGSTTESGVIQSMGAAIQAASIQGRAAWQVGETTYTVLPVTKLDEVNGLLAVGATAEVNSYTAADGSAVATLVRSMGSNQMTYSLFLPTLIQ